MQKEHSIGITGMGIISSIGDDISSFSNSLKKGVSGIKKVELSTNSTLSVNVAAKIENFSFSEQLKKLKNIPQEKLEKAKRLGQRAPFVIQTSIIVALQAWEAAGLFETELSSQRIGLVIAGQNSTQNYQYNKHLDFVEAPEYLSPRYALEFLETNQVGVLSELFGIQGEGVVVGGASATGNVGLIKGHQLLQLGIVDVCLVVAVVADLSPIDIQGFINIGAMGGKTLNDQPSEACRPFDKKHEGFIYGQASASVVLESSVSAKQRNVSFKAEMLAGVVVLDGNSSANPNQQGEYDAMKLAVEKSGLLITDIDYINSHGSSSPLGDKTEAAAISELLGKHSSEVWINATKGLTGHCLYAAGTVEVIATAIQMNEGFLHPNKNLNQPIIDTLNFCSNEAIKTPIKVAVSNSFGFGGINTSIVLKHS